MGRSKVLFAALFLFLTVSVVNAYTVGMRDGRRVEIPNEFAITNSTLTYDVGIHSADSLRLGLLTISALESRLVHLDGSDIFGLHRLTGFWRLR